MPEAPPPAARFTLPPAWLLVCWLLVLISVWPVLQARSRKAALAPAPEMAESARLYQSHRYPEAIAAAQRYLRAHPDSAEAMVNIGISYAALKNWAEGIKYTQQALVLKPDFQLAWGNLRFMLAARDAEHPTAESWWRQATEAYQNRNYPVCIADSTRALALWPQYPKALNVQALCFLATGSVDLAIEREQEALRIEPTFELARNNLAMAMAQKAKGPAPQAPPALQPTPGADANALVNSSVAHYRAGRMQACIDDARAALKLNPKLAVAYNNIAACSNDLGRPDDAIVAANEALRLQPDFELARNNLAVAVNLKIKRDTGRK
jgi:tetratricopeptide (TPR) repeat protein